MDNMASIPVQYLIDQIKDLKSDMQKGFDKVEERLTGNDGVLERLTTLEVQMTQVAKNSSLSSYPPPSSAPVKRKKSIKDHAPALGAGAGATGLLYMLVELANNLLNTK